MQLRTGWIRLLLGSIVVISGCDATAPDKAVQLHDRVGPPLLPLIAVAEAQSASGGVDLVVTVGVRNTLSVAVLVYTTASCAPFVALYPNSSGEAISQLNGSMICPSGSTSVSVAPGDSIRLVRRVTASELTGLPAGKYLVDATITTSLYAMGRSLGNIDLPLTGR